MGAIWWALLFLVLVSVSDSLSSDDVQSSTTANFIGRALTDGNAKPCEDFYESICGSWIRNDTILIDGENYTNAQDLFWKEVDGLLSSESGDGKDEKQDRKLSEQRSKMKVAYKQCLDHGKEKDKEAERELQSLLQRLGIKRWPMPTDSKKSKVSNSKWIGLFVNTSTALDLNVLLDISVKPDEKESSKYAITAKMPTLGIDKHIFRLRTEEKELGLKAYAEYIEETIRLYDPKRGKQCAGIAEKIVEFERMLEQMSDPFWSEEQNGSSFDLYGDNNVTIDYSEYDYDENSTYAPQVEHTAKEEPEVDITNITTATHKTVSDLSTLVPGVDLKSLLTKLFAKVSLTIQDSDRVVVDDRTYYSRLSKILNSTDGNTLINYFGWRVIQTIGPLIHSGMDAARIKFDTAMNISQTYQTRKELCLQEYASEHGTARELIGRLYAEKHISKKAKKNVEALVKSLKGAYKGILENAAWLSNITQKNALHKLDMMRAKIGYAEQLMDDSYIQQAYAWMKDIKPGDPLLTTLQLFRTNRRLNELKNLHGTYNRTRDIGFVSPSAVDAYYSPLDNTLEFPAASLQIPFYSEQLPGDIVMGQLGWTIGRIMSYGLDFNGGWFRGDGSLLDTNYWSKDSKKQREAKANCFNTLYNNVSSAEHTYTRRSLRADIADNAGLEATLKALSMADPDCELPGVTGNNRGKVFFTSAALGMCLNMRELILRRPLDTHGFSSTKQRVNFPFGNEPQFATAFSCGENTYMNFKKKCTFW